MSKIKSITYYVKKFEAWRNYALSTGDYTLCSRTRNNVRQQITLTEEEIRSFQPCYTTDMYAKYYKIRRQLHKWWFISISSGVLVSMREADERGCPLFIVPYCTGEKNKPRYAYKFDKQINGAKVRLDLDPAKLVLLVSGGKSSAAAEQIISSQGVKALYGDDGVEFHHEVGYPYGGDFIHDPEYRKQLCDTDNIMFLTHDEHAAVTFMPDADHKTDEVTKANYVKKLAHLDLSGGAALVTSDGDHHGTFTELDSATVNFQMQVAFRDAESNSPITDLPPCVIDGALKAFCQLINAGQCGNPMYFEYSTASRDRGVLLYLGLPSIIKQ